MRSILSRGIIHRRDVCVNIAVCPAYGVLRVVGESRELEKDWRRIEYYLTYRA